MGSWRDRINQFTGKSRFVVCRIFIHLAGDDIAPLLGTLNRVARRTIDTEGDLEILGEGLVEICQNLLQMTSNWQSAANEGDICWDEGEAADYFTELFTDSAQRYLSDISTADDETEDIPLSFPITRHLVVMITVACTGEVPDLETNLADQDALEDALKTLINLHYQQRLEAIQIHYSPAQFGDELTHDQILLNFSELVPL